MVEYLINRAYQLNSQIKHNLQQCELVALLWLIEDSIADQLTASIEQSCKYKFKIHPSEITISQRGGSASAIVTSNTNWKAPTTVDWNIGNGQISISGNGYGNGLITFESTENDEIDRQQQVPITVGDSSINYILVKQNGLRQPFETKDGDFLLADNKKLITLKHDLQK